MLPLVSQKGLDARLTGQQENQEETKAADTTDQDDTSGGQCVQLSASDSACKEGATLSQNPFAWYVRGSLGRICIHRSNVVYCLCAILQGPFLLFEERSSVRQTD